MSRFVHIVAPAALLLSATAAAAAPAAPAEPVQLVQAGDGQKSCAALAEEINLLATAEAAPVRRKKGFSLGGIGKVLMVANPVLGLAAGAMGGAGMGGLIAGQMAGAAQEASLRPGSAPAAPAASSIETQRKVRLLAAFQAKGC